MRNEVTTRTVPRIGFRPLPILAPHPRQGVSVMSPALTLLQLETRFWGQNYLDLV